MISFTLRFSSLGMHSLPSLRVFHQQLETRRSDAVVEVYVTAVPVKGASDALSLIRKLLPDDGGLDFQHLRRFAKSSDVPEHVRESYAAARDAANRDHTTHSSSHSEPLKLFLIVGPVSAISLVVLKITLSKILGDLVIFTTKVPLLAPTSQEQAKSWTEQYWPTVYKKNNPFGPHPSIIDRAEEEIRNEVEKWMDLAHQVASETSEAGSGERVGVVVVERKAGKAKVVAVAGDARWKGFDIGERRGAGNVTAHAVMRVIGIVAGALKKRDEESQDSIETAVEMTDDPRLDGATYSPSEYSSRSIDTPTLLHLRSSSSTHSRYTIDAENENDNLIATGSIAFVSLTSNLSTEIPKNKNEADSTLSIAADSSTNPIPRMEEIPKSSESDKEQDGASRRVSGAEVQCQDNREIFQDRPLLGVEKQHFDPDGNQNGYLCHDLEIYCTHEPCVMCSMAIVHSRFGRVIFERRMEKTGGMSADGELGHGLAWRKELNWTLLAWQWQRAADEEEKSNCGDLHA
ncbi:related to TAD3 Subunit of tRNA-specific adenosine-34 deaminase [Phialocephala subalpina]|uniref:Related to TAD3 Subunit of tRNA-specific adenosine-34 deaminase n=1 Tax=Phialocephala subalpina TaxID=576137 RepID=A0A1L7WMB1_9HELO|nr:related to TAD3 Subunit of tRNA-specific adenosine-34 deaminase [Phialocephala subalpina]